MHVSSYIRLKHSSIMFDNAWCTVCIHCFVYFLVCFNCLTPIVSLLYVYTHAILHGLTSIVNNHPAINDQTHHLHSRSIKNLPNMELHWHDNWLWTSCLACGGVSSSVWTGKGHHGEMKNKVVAFQTDPPGWWLMWNIHHTNVHINIYIYIYSYLTLSHAHTHTYIYN